MSSSPPTTLGKYQIIREIARSNDIVYEAYDPLMNRRVALKELAVPHGSTDVQRQERIKRFLREAKAAGSLSHPNIMTVYEVGHEGDRNFIAMEFLDGHTLRNEIDTHGSLAPDRGIDIALEVLEGLQFAHKSGVVHRDIKPDNIQLLSDGRIKLTDFGIARLTFEPNLTMDGQVFGTPSYMSPEQVVGKEIDARSDLFSVGIVLYEMISGQKPFTGDSVVSITYAIMNKEPERLQSFNFAVWQVLSRALDKSPALRYASAGEMIEALTDAKNAGHSVVLDTAPPIQTPYGNPYAAPTGNPYMTPGMPQPMPQAPPMSYPYNPYQQPGQQTMQQPGATTVPPGYMPQLPIYYPPPPRQPLIKPETKRFMVRLLVTMGLLASLFGLVIVVVWSAGQVYERVRNQGHDKAVRSQIAQLDKNLPLPDRITKQESLVLQLKDDVAVKDEKRALALLYRQDADRLLKAGDDSGAERRLQQAVETDGDSPESYAALGNFYMAAARRLPDPVSQALMYRGASTQFEEALTRQADRAAGEKLADALAEASLSAAHIAQQLGDIEGLQYDLRRAEKYATSEPIKKRAEALRQLVGPPDF